MQWFISFVGIPSLRQEMVQFAHPDMISQKLKVTKSSQWYGKHVYAT